MDFVSDQQRAVTLGLGECPSYLKLMCAILQCGTLVLKWILTLKSLGRAYGDGSG